MSLQDILNTQDRRLAEMKGWRFVDDGAGRFTVQRKRKFLFIPFWTSEYFCLTKHEALEMVKEKAL